MYKIIHKGHKINKERESGTKGYIERYKITKEEMGDL